MQIVLGCAVCVRSTGACSILMGALQSCVSLINYERATKFAYFSHSNRGFIYTSIFEKVCNKKVLIICFYCIKIKFSNFTPFY